MTKRVVTRIASWGNPLRWLREQGKQVMIDLLETSAARQQELLWAL
jgi:hypothetical protein